MFNKKQIVEKISKNLDVPYVYLPKYSKYICSNGVVFTLAEYKAGIDIKKEYEKRALENKLYDYEYAKKKGKLRIKKSEVKSPVHNTSLLITVILTFTVIVSMYISTLHTATYLYEYTDIFSSWLMSASVTAYNSTAFELSVIFHRRKRNTIAFIYMFLWVLVTLFSMATTVSVFYDSYNFNEITTASENKTSDSSRLQIELLKKTEEDLVKAISFKEKDILYRQEKNYATSAVRIELTKLQEELMQNRKEQQKILSEVPEAVKSEGEIKKKESLFAFFGRLLHLEGGIFEFIMSTLSAIFINLIAPFSLSAVSELKSKKN